MDEKKLKILAIISIMALLFIVLEVIMIFKMSFNTSTTFVLYDSINSFSLTGDGYVAVGSNNNNDNHYEKAKLSVYNFSSEIVMEKIYNKGYNSTYYDVISVEDGYVAVGSYESTKNELKSGNRTAFIVKYDKLGNILFEKDFNVLGNSKFVGVVEVDNHYIVCGQSIYKNKDTTSEGSAILMKYDKEGNELWRKNSGETNSAIYKDLVVSDGTIFVVGLDKNNQGVIAKYNLDGDLLNNKYYESVENIGFTAIDIFNNSLYVTTSKYDNGKMVATLVNYDCELDIMNEVVYSTNNNTSYENLVIDENGNIITIGKVFAKENNSYSYDGILGKYNNSLKELAIVNYTSDRDVFLHDIKVFNDKYLVVGDSMKDGVTTTSKFITFSTSLKILGVS